MKRPALQLYGLGHTAAKLRLANGEHPKVVAEMLGHGSVKLTLDTYSHVTPDLQEAASERLERLLFADQPKVRLIKKRSAKTAQGNTPYQCDSCLAS